MAGSRRPAEVLSQRAVNRALLARQSLLERLPLPAAGPGRAAGGGWASACAVRASAGRCSTT